jgi:hypothetical protein
MRTYGQLAQFDNADDLLRGARQLRAMGYTRIRAYSPYPVDGLIDILGRPRQRLPLAMFGAGLAGAVGALAMQYVAAVTDYPINAGGRPLASWPAFAPSAIEVAILMAVLAGYLSFLRGCRLPALHQPIFNVPWFEEATREGFLLLVRADDPCWAPDDTPRQIASLLPLRHAEVIR